MFDSKKKVKLTNAEGVEYKLVKKQLQAIEFNKALLAMYTNQVCERVGWRLRRGESTADALWFVVHRQTSAGKCRPAFRPRIQATHCQFSSRWLSCAERSSTAGPSSCFRLDLRRPSGVVLAGFSKLRLTCLSLAFQQFSDKHPESASGIKLTMAQLYLAQGDA